MRHLHRPGRATLLVLAAAVLPRLAVLSAERSDLLAGLTEKSDRFARTLSQSGTFGFLPHEPSAYTQPLYGFFLAGLYWVFERSWLVVGLSQILLASATALLVLALGRRVHSETAGVIAALVATLHPYLVWHDVHLNREVLDGLLAVALTLVVFVAAERRSARLAGCAGGVAGLAILANSRLALVPFVLAGWLVVVLGGRRGVVAAAALVAASAVVVTPWVVRNKIEVGCATLTTDTRALWKANNPNTYDVLASGRWLDQVPELPGAPPWPELAADITERQGIPTPVDECAQAALYRREVTHFWRTQPGEKARLAAQAVGMLWSPVFTVESDRIEGGPRGFARTVAVPVYVVLLYVLGALGLWLVPRRYTALTLLLLGYGTVMAALFAGTMRYRVPWDFLLAVPAAAALLRGWELVRTRREARAA